MLTCIPGFFTAANKAKQQILLGSIQVAIDDYIFVKSDYKSIKIDLIYVEGLKDYLKL